MNINVNDDQFIDLINETTSHLQDEINSLEQEVEGKADQSDVDDFVSESDIEYMIDEKIPDMDDFATEEYCDDIVRDQEYRIDDLASQAGDRDFEMEHIRTENRRLALLVEEMQGLVDFGYIAYEKQMARTVRVRAKRAYTTLRRWLTNGTWRLRTLRGR